MKKIISLIIIQLLFSGVLLKAQYSDTVVTNINDLVFSNNGKYDIINLKSNYSSITDIGAPSLPVKIFKYVLPYNAVVKNVTVTGTSKIAVSGSYFIKPVQIPIPNGSTTPSTPPKDTINSVIYNSSNPYPGKQLVINSDGYELGYHVIYLKFYPVEYIPAKKTLNLYDTHKQFI